MKLTELDIREVLEKALTGEWTMVPGSWGTCSSDAKCLVCFIVRENGQDIGYVSLIAEKVE